jgi:hypothetical protein
MAFDYLASRDDADDLIAEFGQAAILRRPTAATGPIHNPTPGVPVDHAVTLVALKYRSRDVDGTRILSSDRQVLVAAGPLAVEPEMTDKLIIQGRSYSIQDIQPMSPGGVVVYWEIQARA